MAKSYFDGLVQDYIISSTLALEILQSCIKPAMHFYILANL